MSVAAYHAEASRILRDVAAAMQKHRLWTGQGDADAFDRDWHRAIGNPAGRDLRREAMAVAADADIRSRVETVDQWLAVFVNLSGGGLPSDELDRARLGLRDALRALEPFAVSLPDPEPTAEKLLLDPNSQKIAAIARDTAKSADDRMRAICEIDHTFGGKDSTEWGDLLIVSPQAVRQTAFWKRLQDRRTD